VIAGAGPVLGLVVLTLSLQIILLPLPLSNILPAIVILLISLAYLEEDGLSVAISLTAGAGILAINGSLLWKLLQDALPPSL